MKNKFFAALLFLLTISIVSCRSVKAEEFYGIGAEMFQDPFNKKVIITNVIPNSPTEKAGITAGTEIVSVDDLKVRKTCLCQIVANIRGDEGTTLKLVIRNGWRWKTIELTRELITVEEPKINENLETYWKQISPSYYLCTKTMPNEITDKFSRKYRKNILPAVNYWAERKTNFELGYNTCMSYSKNNQEICLINLLNRENQTTLADKKIFKVLRNKSEEL